MAGILLSHTSNLLLSPQARCLGLAWAPTTSWPRGMMRTSCCQCLWEASSWLNGQWWLLKQAANTLSFWLYPSDVQDIRPMNYPLG